MKLKELIFVFSIFVLVAFVFFYKTIFYGQIPFPGDLLIAEYSPWKFYSYLGYTPGSYPNKAQYFDVMRQLYPWKTLAVELFKNGQFPLWNPYSFSGSPLFANVQSALLYPFNIFYLIFPQVFSWTILIVLQPLLASFFTYLYAREIRISRLSSFLAGISYGYSLYMSVFLEYNTIGHVILWLPLLLYLVEIILKRTTFLRLFFFVSAFSTSFMAGHFQLFGFLMGFVSLYIVYRLASHNTMKEQMRTGLTFLMLFIFTIGISSIQLFPTLELIGESARVPQSYEFLVEKLLIQPSQLILLFSPDFFGNPASRNYLINDTYPGNALYIGLVSILFALMGLIGFRKNFYIKLFGLASLILIIFFTRSPITEVFYRFEIPFFSTGSPTNAIFLLSFSLSILCGLGFDIVIDRTHRFFWKPILIFSAFFAVIWMFILTKSIQIVSIKNFFYSTGILFTFFVLFVVLYFRKVKNSIVVGLFLLVAVFDLFYFFQKFNPFVSDSLVFPEAKVLRWLQQNAGQNRFWGYGRASVEPNFSTQYVLFSPDGYDPLYPKRYGEFVQSSSEGRIITEFTNTTRSDAMIARGDGEVDMASNQYRLRVLDMIGARYILNRVENATTEKTFPQERFKLVYKKDGWDIFENLTVAPRFFLTSHYRLFKDAKEFERIFFSKDFDPLKTVLLEEVPKGIQKPYLNDLNHLSTIELLSYKPNKIMAKVITSNPKLLFFSDTYYPDWNAFIDGSKTKVYRANYAFRAVVVPEGVHEVVFAYQPQSFSIGVKVSIISVILALVFAFVVPKKVAWHEE